MGSKKGLFIAAAALGVLILGASVLYSALGDKVEMDALVEKGDAVDSAVDMDQAPAGEADSSGQDQQAADTVKAPDFTVYDGEGNPVKLSDFLGTPVVVNFWASWCPPCKSEMPEFDRVWAQYSGKVQFLMINQTDGSRETVESAQAFVDGAGYSFPVFFDTALEASYLYGVRSIPTTFFIDAEGNAVVYAAGAIGEEVLLKGISMIYTEE